MAAVHFDHDRLSPISSLLNLVASFLSFESLRSSLIIPFLCLAPHSCLSTFLSLRVEPPPPTHTHTPTHARNSLLHPEMFFIGSGIIEITSRYVNNHTIKVDSNPSTSDAERLVCTLLRTRLIVLYQLVSPHPHLNPRPSPMAAISAMLRCYLLRRAPRLRE